MILGGIKMIITFIGHSTLPVNIDLEETLRRAIFAHVPKTERVSFYCGGYGEFDRRSARVAHEIKGEFSAGETVYITPYLNQEEKLKSLMESGIYDSILYPPLENVPYKYAIVKRNEWMVQQADLIFSYVIHGWGGAATTLAFAKRRRKRIIDLTNGGEISK